jgi:hypothetical protein
MVTMKAFLNNKLNKVLTKGGELEMKAKWAFSIIAVISLVLALSPGVAFAAEGDTATGTFGCNNAAPTITDVALMRQSTNLSESSMTPQVEYYVQFTAGDVNTLNDLETVIVYIYYDADGTYNVQTPAAHTQTCAILTWTNPTGWSISPSSTTTWTQNTSTVPSLTGSSGLFKANFMPGKVANESAGVAEWHIYVVANDSSLTGSGYQEDLEMNWYGQIDMTTSSVDWGDVDAGLHFAEDGNSEETGITVTYIANGDYNEQIAASSPWLSTGPGADATLDADGVPSAANSFSLKADDTDTMGSAVDVNTEPSNYITIDSGGTLTSESGNPETTNTIWLSLNDTFVADTYTGTIYYQIENR